MRRDTTILGWLLVLAVLVVPGGFVYSWLDVTVRPGEAQEAPRKPSKNMPLFAASLKRQQLINPTQVPVYRPHPVETPPAPAAAKPAPAPAVREPVKAKPSLPAAARSEAARPLAAPQAEPDPEILREASATPSLARVLPRRRRITREKPIADSLDVQAIIAGEGGNSALVNGHAVKEGDMIGKVKVVLITSEHVTFAYGNQRFVKSI